MPRRFGTLATRWMLAAVLAIALAGLLPVWTDQAAEARASWGQAWGAQAFAQDPAPPIAAPVETPLIAATPEQSQPMNWMMLLIPTIATLTTGFLKMMIPSIPKGWAPWLCIALGTAADVVHTLITNTPMNPALIPVLATAGIGIREVGDQLKQKYFATAG